MIKRVGVIALRKMGEPMVRHLITKNYEVLGFDLDAMRVKTARDLGAAPCGRPKEIAQGSDLRGLVPPRSQADARRQ